MTGLVGAMIARFDPKGMSRALFATSLAMALVPVIALLIGTADFAPGVATVFVLNGGFVMLVGSALLFRRSDVVLQPRTEGSRFQQPISPRLSASSPLA